MNILKTTNKHLISTGSSARHGALRVSRKSAKAACKAARAGSTFKLNILMIGRYRGFGVSGLLQVGRPGARWGAGPGVSMSVSRVGLWASAGT